MSIPICKVYIEANSSFFYHEYRCISITFCKPANETKCQETGKEQDRYR